MKTIALDYDKTFNADKGFWTEFISMAFDRGHRVYIVTLRHPEFDHEEDFDHLKAWMGVETICTDGEPKREFVEAMGVKIDWWIDDRPDSILTGGWKHGSPDLEAWRALGRGPNLTPEDIKAWREKNELQVVE